MFGEVVWQQLASVNFAAVVLEILLIGALIKYLIGETRSRIAKRQATLEGHANEVIEEMKWFKDSASKK